MSVSAYFITGLIFAAFIEVVVRQTPGAKVVDDFGFLARVFLVVLWPLALIIFLKAFFNEYYKNKE